MRSMILVTFGLAAAYGGYWFVGKANREADVARLQTELESRGLEVRYSGLSTRGFPSRFDTRVEDLELRGDWTEWYLPEAEIAALSYRPNELIATLPDALTVTWAGQDFAVTSDRVRAQVTLGGDDLPSMVTIEGTNLQIENLGRADAVLAALRDRGDGSFDAFLSVTNGTAALGPLRTQIDALEVDAVLVPVPGGYDVQIRNGAGTIAGTAVTISGSFVDGIQLDVESAGLGALLLDVGEVMRPGPLAIELW